jgi:beta-galactosidase
VAVSLFFLPWIIFVKDITAQEAQRFFKTEDLMTFGTYYYPEQWNESQWERDIKKMAEMGFCFTHYGEFAWSSMEPEEGKYDFTWLDKSVELAKKYGLKVIMCTPSATPPTIWK